jgi:hypothetical protein
MAHQRRETAGAAHELASAQGGGGGPTDLPDRANQFDQFAPIHLVRPILNGAKSPAPESQFRERIQADWDFQSWLENISFRKSETVVCFAIPSRMRGVSRSSRTLGWDAVDAAARAARN